MLLNGPPLKISGSTINRQLAQLQSIFNYLSTSLTRHVNSELGSHGGGYVVEIFR